MAIPAFGMHDRQHSRAVVVRPKVPTVGTSGIVGTAAREERKIETDAKVVHFNMSLCTSSRSGLTHVAGTSV